MSVKIKSRKVSVGLEHRFYQYDGRFYTKLAFSYSYWENYLLFFDEVVVVARVEEVDSIDSSYKLVDGKGVSFFSMPYYVGPKEFMFKIHHLIYSAYKAVSASDALILRSGNISNLLWIFSMIKRVSYLREFPGNIKEGIIGYGGRSFINVVLATFLDYLARLQAKFAKANSYVSEYCRSLYPSDSKSYVFSSFNCDEIKKKKTLYSEKLPLKLVTVGRLEGEKGHEDLIRSLHLLGNSAALTVVGDGTKKQALINLAQELSINVTFLGAITDRDELFGLLESSDLFVMPSHTEGMPRALLEAMAIGLPCIGTNVGGIPEVLEKCMLFSPSDPLSCAELINKLVVDIKVMQVQGRRNRKFIQGNYSKKILDEKKIKFWSELYP